MSNLTIRDIPEDVLEKIKIISRAERRSINSEILLLLENALSQYIAENSGTYSIIISKDVQLEIWSSLSGRWEDDRSTSDLIDDIYTKRTKGRNIEI